MADETLTAEERVHLERFNHWPDPNTHTRLGAKLLRLYDAALARAEAAEKASDKLTLSWTMRGQRARAAEARLAAAVETVREAVSGLDILYTSLTALEDGVIDADLVSSDVDDAREMLRTLLSTAPAQAVEPAPLDKLFGAVPDMPLEPAATDAETALRELRDRCAGVVAVLESGLQSRNYAAFAARVLEAFSRTTRSEPLLSMADFISLDSIRALLASQGLRVVDEKDWRVLEACSAFPDEVLNSQPIPSRLRGKVSDCSYEWTEAELARRKP